MRQVVPDSADRPVAVIETTAVWVVRLDDVDLEHALGEGEEYPMIDFEEQVQSAGQRVLPTREARWGPQPGSLEQTSEPLSPARAAIGVIQAHKGRGQPEPFVFLHLPAQPRLRRRRLIPAANQLGVHIVGPHASDLISEGVLAIEMAARPADVAATIHPHPTLSEGVYETAARYVHEAAS